MTVMTTRCFYILLLLTCFALLANGQDTTGKSFVKVSGEVTKPLTLYAADLAKMKQIPLPFKGHDAKPRRYTGVSVWDILQQAGVTLGKDLRGKNLTKYMMVKCADGYAVLFSLAEFDSSFTDRKIALAYQADGKPLPQNDGPFQLIVPGEKKPARSCRQVTELVINSIKD